MRTRSSNLGRYVVVRILQAVPLLLGVVVVNFTLVHLAPGDPITALTGEFPAPPEYVARLRAEFGLDRPLWEQLFRYIVSILQGNLGFSFIRRAPVLDLVVERAGPTALLMLSAMALSVLLGVLLGVVSARRVYSATDNALTVAGLVGYSIPVFWLGQVLIVLFALTLGWLPASGMVSLRTPPEGLARALDIGAHLLLPALCLSTRYIALNTRITRTSMLEVMHTDYIVTAKAKGLPERAILVRHALRNALLPVVTIVGYNLGFALSGSVLVETVFGWPGLGRLLFESIGSRDYPLLLGIFLFLSVVVVVTNLVTDILYAYLDPRIRY
jgi:peptide/nickel transport system permease protein